MKIKAIYKDGVFKLEEDIKLHEGKMFELIIYPIEEEIQNNISEDILNYAGILASGNNDTSHRVDELIYVK